MQLKWGAFHRKSFRDFLDHAGASRGVERRFTPEPRQPSKRVTKVSRLSLVSRLTRDDQVLIWSPLDMRAACLWYSKDPREVRR